MSGAASAVAATVAALRKSFERDATRPQRLHAVLNRVGICERKDATFFVRANRVEVVGVGKVISVQQRVLPTHLLINGAPLKYCPPAIVALHKPVGFVCSRSRDESEGRLVHELFTGEYEQRCFRNHQIAGRLDRMASGLVVLTDNGLLNNFLRSRLPKVYEIETIMPFSGSEQRLFASGTLQLRDEATPCLPVEFEPLGERKARVTLYEGRYRQLRRMFGAVGNRVAAIHRTAVAGIQLGPLKPGQWRLVTPSELEHVLQQVPLPLSDATKEQRRAARLAARAKADAEKKRTRKEPAAAAADAADVDEFEVEDGEEDEEGMRVLSDDDNDDNADDDGAKEIGQR